MTRDIEPGPLNDVLRGRLGARRLVLFLDYDGTLTPIVERPELAVLADDMRRVLERLVTVHPVYIISGRDLGDIRRLVDVEGVHFVGSHGFHMLEALPGLDQQALAEAMPELEAAADELERRLDCIDGVLVERKKFSFAVHHRLADPRDLKQINAAAEGVLERYGSLNVKKGKKVIEFVPDIPWDKGRCVQALLERAREQSGDRDLFPVYLGDDTTDEDAFRVLGGGDGLGILVADDERSSAAEYRLPDTGAVKEFLRGLI